MSSDDRHNPGEKMEHRTKRGRPKTTYMGSISGWTEISTVESFYMALNRFSWRERTWQAVQAADAPTVIAGVRQHPGGVGPDGRRWMSE
ncbi:hypothetical protein RRG08_006083 [Elysia crispata]|uniref:Uncharacterized protein n=1 Tax=Elysia crispata TaxID=231223 RepID=A0AAE1CT15_9GAST|nr:hypothetical protein RRG08_006083 [Elysia crispata]